MSSVIAPHGGHLVQRVMPDSEKVRLKEQGLCRLTIDNDFVMDVEKIAVGAFSPLTGFMCKDDFESVIHRMKLACGIPWTIPVFLPVNKDVALSLSKKEKVILVSGDGVDIALLEIRDIFKYPKDVWVKKVFSTDDDRHPGVKRIYGMPEYLLGGDIKMINRTEFSHGKYNLEPAEVREMIRKRGWRTVAGFQTRNVPHRAHEFLQKQALAITDGLLIHPILGWKKKGDFQQKIIIDTYKTLIKEYFPKNSVIFAGLATAMHYAGPREAVFHAIIRKNYGCTHFIVGRDHAGVGDFYDKYAAHRIFDKIDGLGIQIMFLRGPSYCTVCREIVSDKICPHDDKKHIEISGTTIRKMLNEGKNIPEYLLRPEVARILAEHKNEIFI
ncbi:MAG: sulfate adenylyltransferase [Candidatus Omnitrophica bacterium]|nr:sulfate adenylyltransferase [Candidatus Omnitrophota bacterium]